MLSSLCLRVRSLPFRHSERRSRRLAMSLVHNVTAWYASYTGVMLLHFKYEDRDSVLALFTFRCERDARKKMRRNGSPFLICRDFAEAFPGKFPFSPSFGPSEKIKDGCLLGSNRHLFMPLYCVKIRAMAALSQLARVSPSRLKK